MAQKWEQVTRSSGRAATAKSLKVAEGKGFEPSKDVAALNGLANRHPAPPQEPEKPGEPQKSASSAGAEARKSRERKRFASAREWAHRSCHFVPVEVRPTERDLERLWAKIDQLGPDECWPWKGAVSGAGYGRFKLQGRFISPHRVTYQLEYGKLPHMGGWHGPIVRHTCDNPRCCNPRHLRVGTQAQNVADMVERGRGSTVRRAKTDAETARRIYDDPRPHRIIAAEFGVSDTFVGKIKRGERLAWLLKAHA